jgi:cobalt-zinc-cadmium efflux system outer membrane protein
MRGGCRARCWTAGRREKSTTDVSPNPGIDLRDSMRRPLRPLGLAAFWLSPLLAAAQPAAPLTLDQALQRAATRSFVVSAARRGVEAAEGALRQAGARRNPELHATVEDTRPATRTTIATLDVPFEPGGRRDARVGVAARAHEMAQAELDRAGAELRAAVVAAYVRVRLAQERVALADDSAALAARGADAVARRVAAGKVSPVDETRARVDQANAQLEATDARAELQAARHALAASWGDAEPDFAQVAGDIGAPPARPAVAELLREVDASPALRAARAEVERRRAVADVERRSTLGDVTLSVGARRENELGRTQAVVGVALPLPLFDRNEGAIHEALRRADQAADEHQAARVRTIAEIQQAAAQLAAALASLQTLQATVLPAAQQAHDAATRGFEAGKFGVLDVIDAQRSLLQARTRWLNTLAAAHQAATAIDRLLGRRTFLTATNE